MKGDEPDDHSSQRERLVDSWIAMGTIHDPRVLDAMRRVPREAFVPEELLSQAYEEVPLPIGEGQTISQPFVVARMAEALGLVGTERVLEVGTGSGYAAAVFSLLAREVHTIERIPVLASAAGERLRRLGYSNVQVHLGDGTRGWAAAEPYDAIVVAAAAAREPPELARQLAIGGRLLLPLGSPEEQVLVQIRRDQDGYRREELDPVRFVPLIAEEPVGSSGAR